MQTNSQTQPAVIDALDWDVIVGRRVHHIMWDRHITQTALGRQIGIDQSALGKRLRGKHGWSLNDIKKVAAALGTTTEYLLREDDGDEPTPNRGAED